MTSDVESQTFVTEHTSQNNNVKQKNIQPSQYNIAAAKIRRQRGYQWEDTLVKRFNSQKGWKAFRLGSPSTGLPDILAVNTHTKHLIVIEAKSGSGNTLSVPADQIERCMMWINTFSAYKKRHVILAYKFGSKMRIGTARYSKRPLREFYKIRGPRTALTECICTYDGKFYAKHDNKSDTSSKVPIYGTECIMPFKTKQPSNALKNARIIF